MTHIHAGRALFSIIILAAVVVVWAAMMIRKMMIIIAAVLTPLAFSGATADITRGWVRRWIEFMAAMIASKLLLVIIFMIGVSVMEGAGMSAQPGPGQQLTQLATGSLILLMGGFAPWAAIKMFHFSGDVLHSAHATALQAPSGARSVLAAPQKVNALHSQATHTASKFRGANGGPSAGNPPPRDSAELLKDKPGQGGYPGGRTVAASSGTELSPTATARPLSAGSGTSATAAGSGGAAAGGSAAAATVVAPVVVAAATMPAAKKAGTAAANTASQAAPESSTSPVQEWPHRRRPS